jgi:hypothetical protein
MMRLALVLAAAAFGTGCVFVDDDHDCDFRDLTVTWSGFDGPAPSSVNLSCGAAGVAFVAVYFDGQLVSESLCADFGVTLLDVPAGGFTLTIEGVSGDGETILYRENRDLSVGGCGDFAVDARPAAGTVNLDYAFQSGSACAATPSFLWFSIFDLEANLPAATIDALSSLGEKRTFVCPADVIVELPVGTYELDFMQEVVEGPATVFTEAALACGVPLPFTVSSRATTVRAVSLADSGAACF